MKFRFSFLTVTFLFLTVASFKAVAKKADKELQTIDRVYEENIKSPLLYPNTSTLKDVLQPPVISLTDNRSLLLSFDELGNNTDNYMVQILNCNADWTLSNLNAILYLSDYNEFQIMDRQPSYNTRIPYIHYKFIVPKTKISGNFLIMVYRDGDDTDIILTRRFMVYESNVTITPMIKFPVSNSERNTGQQVDFSIYYNNNIQNPMDRMSVVLRQNYNWSNAIYGLKPVFMRDDVRTYDYTFFNNENVFKGGNEFRFFDLRSLKSNGMNVSKIIQTDTDNQVLLGYDKSRGTAAYGSSIDLNGFFAPEQYETKGYEIEPDYARVTFSLDMKPEDVPGRVFIFGALTEWSLNAAYEMKWDAQYKVFTTTVLLKQGYYNYEYAFLPKGGNTPDYTFLEGSSSQTENMYDIIVYYRAAGGLSDRIVGYKSSDYLAR